MTSAMQAVETTHIDKISDFPVTIDNIPIENIQFSAKFSSLIKINQTEKNSADAEKHKQACQNIEVQGDVNTAKARADGIKLIAIAEAGSIRIKGLADAETITAKALGDNAPVVKLTEAQN